MLHGNERIIKHKLGLLNLQKNLEMSPRLAELWDCPETLFTVTIGNDRF